MKTIAAGTFKATCLAVIDEVHAKREPVLITRNGKPVARLIPVQEEQDDPIFGFYKGKLKVTGDIISPIVPRNRVDRRHLPRHARRKDTGFQRSSFDLVEGREVLF